MRWIALALALCGCTELDVFTSGAPWRGVPLAVDAPRGSVGRSRVTDGVWRIEADLAPTCAADGCDLDADGLADAWEAMLLDKLRPIVRIGGAEELLEDPDATLGSVGRVTPGNGDEVFVAIVLAYSRDYGRCGFTEHSGDSERVALRVARDGTVRAAYTAAHEGTSVDAGAVMEPWELTFVADPVTGDARWYVLAVEGKHATYASAEACAAFSDTTCLAESCPRATRAPDLELLIPIVDAGEPGTGWGWHDWWPYPFTEPYDPSPFCGDRWVDGVACAQPIRDKLLADPFDDVWRE